MSDTTGVNVSMLCTAMGVHYGASREEVYKLIRALCNEEKNATHQASYRLGYIHGTGEMPETVPEPHWGEG